MAGGDARPTNAKELVGSALLHLFTIHYQLFTNPLPQTCSLLTAHRSLSLITSNGVYVDPLGDRTL